MKTSKLKIVFALAVIFLFGVIISLALYFQPDNYKSPIILKGVVVTPDEVFNPGWVVVNKRKIERVSLEPLDIPGAIEIDVEGQMFSWLFIYPNDKETENELVVPEGKPVKLNVSSVDVLHSLFIPAFRVKVDAVKGMSTYVWFYADKQGLYDIMCAEYCGTDHSLMRAVLKIVPEEEYNAWLETDEDEDE